MLACFTALMAGNVAFAQTTDATITEDQVKDKEQFQKFKEGQTKYPAKPRDMWELGIHGGYLQYSGDVNQQPGYAFGLHLRKSLGYSFAIRLNAMYGVAKGLNYLPSYWGVGKNDQLGVGGVGYGKAVANENDILENAIGSGDKYFYNYRSTYAEGTVQGILTLNNLKFHKERNKWDLFVIGGIGAATYSTKHNALKGDPALKQRYNGSDGAKGMNDIRDFVSDNADGRRQTKEALKAILDDTYETRAEEWGYLWDPFSDGNNEEKNKTRKINPVANAGVGIGYKLSRRVSLTLEHQATFHDDDLLDGYRWTEQRDFTQNKDVPHYTNLRLNFHLGSFKKRVEPLWWLNPLDAPMAQLQKAGEKPKLDLDDEDKDGVPDQLDREPGTPADCPVDTHGVMLDSDGDGVKDCYDKEPHSRPGAPVDDKGVARPAAAPAIDCASCPPSDMFLPLVHFCNDSYCLQAEYQAQLKGVANMMNQNSKMNIIVEGYADDGYTGADATSISYARAKAVADYLTRQGISSSRLTIKAKGDAEKAAPSAATDSERFFNRRVELKMGSGNSDAAPSSMKGNSSNCSCNVPPPPPPVYINTPAPTYKPPRVRPNRGPVKG